MLQYSHAYSSAGACIRMLSLSDWLCLATAGQFTGLGPSSLDTN